MLSISRETTGDVVALRMSGAIDGGESCRAIHEAIRKGLDSGLRKFVFNLANVEWINSLGVGFLVAASVSATGQDAVVRIVGMTARVDSVLQASGVVPHIWQNFATEEDALASFS